ncbi:TRAP transporter small permease [Elioraea tepida]|jgi:TRAP-type C4-dicarboxylate transport system permease small subunit|uniref:TRAP transporter small permease protein n=1 Tax=Elioraea tepida TaxID=2843330 RepID=A0A975U401_9PROT|nr:TRAP transporter small permease [Elioraea tepida]QXM26041.1 TRAP transporter small permease [Elioraea tepida]
MAALLDRLIGVLGALARGGAWFGGALLFAAAFMIGAEVLLRKLAGISIGGADELAGYVLAIASAWAFGFALLSRAHIRIDTLYALLPKRLQALLDLVALALTTFFFGFLAWFAWAYLMRTVSLGARSMTPLQTPLAIPQSLWVAGLIVFVSLAALLWLRALIAVLAGDLTTSARLIGSRTAKQEVEEEIAEAKAILERDAARR